MFKLNDFISIKPDEKLVSMTDSEKEILLDEFTKTKKTKKGLFITYDLSHSGRRINNRIYPTAGQQAGINTVLKPYPKPILQHHDKSRDPIGRFVSAEWEDLSNEAIGFFNRIEDFMEVKAAYDSDSPENIYQAMKKYNLLSNKDWPGMGRMRVKAQITDKEAIQKFLDGRYITFSAGSSTDRHVCSICSSDWAKGDMCEHRHGKIYDGDVCVFVTGAFNVMEGSVVNMPADDLSQLQSMELISEDGLENFDSSDFKIDSSGIIITDSFYSLEETDMKIEEEKVVEKTAEDNSDSETQTQEESLEDKIVEKVTRIITEKFSDIFSKLKEREDEEKSEIKKEEKEVESKDLEQVNEQKDEQADEKQEKESGDGAGVRGLQASVQDETASEEKVVGDTDGDINQLINEDIEVDWYLLDCALTFELGDKALTTEQRKELPDSVFCGPERSFPVNDCAHVTAAKRLIGRAKLSDQQKKKVLDCVDRKSTSMKCETKEVNQDFDKEISSLKKEIKALKEKLSLDSKEEEVIITEDNTVENPSIASTDESSITDVKKNSELGSYEKNFIKDYKKILEEDGELKANNFYFVKSRYLKKGFDPKKYI